jgi:hypothetical protein
MTPRERATAVVYGMLGNNFSRQTFDVMAADKSETGDFIRKWIVAVEKGIEADRKEQASARAPS